MKMKDCVVQTAFFVQFEARFGCLCDAWDKSISSAVSRYPQASPLSVSL